MRYGAETDREDTLISYFDETLPETEGLEDELNEADDRISYLHGLIDEIMTAFEDKDDKEFLEFISKEYKKYEP